RVAALQPVLVLLPLLHRAAIAPLAIEDREEARRQLGLLDAPVRQQALRRAELILRDHGALGQAEVGARGPRSRRRQEPAAVPLDAAELRERIAPERVGDALREEALARVDQPPPGRVG